MKLKQTSEKIAAMQQQLIVENQFLKSSLEHKEMSMSSLQNELRALLIRIKYHEDQIVELEDQVVELKDQVVELKDQIVDIADQNVDIADQNVDLHLISIVALSVVILGLGIGLAPQRLQTCISHIFTGKCFVRKRKKYKNR